MVAGGGAHGGEDRQGDWKHQRRSWKAVLVGALPPLPGWLWDGYVGWKVGNQGPAEPRVDFVDFRGAEPAPVQRLVLADLPPVPAEGVLRLVFVSDTHERHRLVPVPPGDVLLYCGDILMSSSLARQHRGLRVLRDFNAWLRGVPCAEKVVIGGNHDTALERLGDAAQEMLSAGILLQDAAVPVTAAGLKVYGNAYSEGKSHNRAWQSDSPTIGDACAGADVVITHHFTPRVQREVFKRCRPRIWASGHEHDEHGVRWADGTLYVNAAIQDPKHSVRSQSLELLR